MIYIELILIGISLSMDAFALAMCFNTVDIKKSKNICYELAVGIFHFFMPLLGYFLKNIIDKVYVIPSKPLFIVVILFIIIGICIDKETHVTNALLNPLVFAFTVSLDSFSIGLTLNKNVIIVSCLIFSLLSMIFTIFGFKIGSAINKTYSNISKYIAIFILIIVIVLNTL